MAELKICPFCGSDKHLNFQLIKARGSSFGQYNASIYCRKCGCYGPRTKIKVPDFDIINGIPTNETKQIARKVAAEIWNRRVE